MGRGFDPSASWIPAQLRKPVKEALDMGWTPAPNRIKAGGWFIYSPKRTHKFYVPITCKDPDNVAKKLRSLMSSAYLNEKNAFEPDFPRNNQPMVDQLAGMAEALTNRGARIIPGAVPQIECPVCDTGFTDWDGFAAHQEACLAAAAAANTAELEEVPETVTDSTESVHSGTIGTKEETPLATESTTPTPKPGPKKPSTPTHDPKTGRKRGYSWTQVKGKENPLHEVLYEACRYTRRFKNETDSKYSLRLAQYIEDEALLDRLAFDVNAEAGATLLLDKIRELLGVEEAKPDEGEIEKLNQDIAERDAKIETLTEKVTELRGVLQTLSSMAEESNQ